MSEQRPYWNMNIEVFLNTHQMKELQLYKLKVMLNRLKENAVFHRERFKKAGVNIDKITSLEDFSKAVPIYDKAEYRQHAIACDGDLIKLMDREMPVSVDDLVMINSTTGTSGEPTPYPLCIKDIYDVWGEVIAGRGAWRAGLRKKDRILYCFALSMVIAGVGSLVPFQKIGATTIPVGAESGTDRMFQMAKFFKPTVFMGTPSLASYLLEKGPENDMDPKSLGINMIFAGGEPGAGVPEIRDKLEKGFGAKLFDCGAGYGFSCDSPEYQGLHWLADDLCLYELVDPKTREPIPLEDGARGEAVFTNLEGDGWNWVRTSLGDIHEVTMSPCSCGGTGFRYKIVGRNDDMLKVKGVIVYPTQVAGLLENFTPRVSGEFRIVLTEEPPLVIPPLKIKIEKGHDFSDDKLDVLEKELLDAFHLKMKIRPEIIWKPAGSLDRSTYKGTAFEKRYAK